MTTEVTQLDPQETSRVLGNTRTVGVLGQIAEGLAPILDTEASLFVVGLNESTINSLRTRMYRKNIKVVVRKVTRDGQTGHILLARSI